MTLVPCTVVPVDRVFDQPENQTDRGDKGDPLPRRTQGTPR